MKNGMRPIHPGEVLREEFMKPLELSARALAEALFVPPNRITGLINAERSLTASTALRLARYFGTTPEFWLNLQLAFDLRTEEVLSAKSTLSKIVPHPAARPATRAASRPSAAARA